MDDEVENKANAKNDPSVRLQRDPWIEALLLTSGRGGPFPVPPGTCHLCGKEGNWLPYSEEGKKWTLFLTLLKGLSDKGPTFTCSPCLSLMKTVWDLEARIREMNLLFSAALKDIKWGHGPNIEDVIKIEVDSDEEDLQPFGDGFLEEPPYNVDDVSDNDANNIIIHPDEASTIRRGSRTRTSNSRKSNYAEVEEDSDESFQSPSESSEDEEDPIPPPNKQRKIKVEYKGRKDKKSGGDKGDFTCSKCGHNFCRRRRQVFHEVFVCKVEYSVEDVMKRDVRIFCCDLCDLKSSDAGDLFKHYPRHGAIPDFFLCSECPSTFPSEKEVKVHHSLTGHKGKKRNEEAVKGLTAKFRSSLSAILLGTPSDKPRLAEPEPKKLLLPSGSKEEGEVGSIVDKALLKREKSCLCPICGKTFLDRRYFRDHMAWIHRNPSEPEASFQCPLCTLTFPTPGKLKQHKRNVHKPGYPCSVCDVRFNHRTHLKKHERTHEDRSVKCSKCGKSYAFPHLLERHERMQPNCDVIHYKEKVHRFVAFEKTCPFPGCGDVLKTRKIYRKHLLQKHKDMEGLEKELEESKCPPSLYSAEKQKERRMKQQQLMK